MFILHVWPPLFSAFVHGILVALYAVSIDYQASSDMTDPQHPQRGAPWYITKSCSVAFKKKNLPYCLPAKAAFARTCVMFGIFLFQFILAVYSCFPNKEYKQELSEKHEAKRARAAMLEESSPESYHWPKTAFDLNTPVPRTPGSTGGIKSPPLNPMTPRTLAFNKLGGTKDLPLRNHFSTPNSPKSPTYSMQSPEFSRPGASPRSPGFERARVAAEDEEQQDGVREVSAPAMYFPPPPKVATR